MFEIFCARDGFVIDRCPNLERAIEMLLYYYGRYGARCMYGLRPVI